MQHLRNSPLHGSLTVIMQMGDSTSISSLLLQACECRTLGRNRFPVRTWLQLVAFDRCPRAILGYHVTALGPMYLLLEALVSCQSWIILRSHGLGQFPVSNSYHKAQLWPNPCNTSPINAQAAQTSPGKHSMYTSRLRSSSGPFPLAQNPPWTGNREQTRGQPHTSIYCR